MTVVTCVWLASLAASFTIAAHALRGRRVGEHPRCRRCDYDLFGVPATSRACPECGASLDAPRAVITGRRQRRTLLGALAIVAVIALLALRLPTVGAAARAAWARVVFAVEERRLIARARDAEPARRRDATNALVTFYCDDDDRRMSAAGGKAIVAALADGSLGQPNTPGPWRCVPSDYETAVWCLRRQLNFRTSTGDRVARRMLRAALALRLEVAPRAPRGGTLRYRVRQPAPMLFDDLTIDARADTLDGRPVGPPTQSVIAPNGFFFEDELFGSGVALDPARGPSTATLAIRVRVTASIGHRDEVPVTESAELVLTGTTEIVEPDALRCPPQEKTAGDAWPDVTIERFPNNAGLIFFTGPSRGAVFADAFLRTEDGRERPLGGVFLDGTRERWARLDDVPAGPYEVVFRPTPSRGGELFEPVAIPHETIAVPSSRVRVVEGLGSRNR